MNTHAFTFMDKLPVRRTRVRLVLSHNFFVTGSYGEGMIVEDGKPKDIFEAPRHERTAAFLKRSLRAL